MWGGLAVLLGLGQFGGAEAEYTSHSTRSIGDHSKYCIGLNGSLTIHVYFILITGNGWFAIKILFSTHSARKRKKRNEFDFNFPGFREKIKESGQRTGFSPKYFAV
jgi:hypothetical protein